VIFLFYQKIFGKDFDRKENVTMGFLTGKTAIITGGGRSVLSDGRCGSIGYGIATAYAKEGANIVITGRNVKKLEDAKEELERLYGIKVLAAQADVSAGADNEAVVDHVVKQTMDTFGRIDVLINNAQASASGVTLTDHTTEQFDLALYSGLYATFYYMKACHPHLAETKGTVINFASGAGLFGNYGQCAYAAAKEGVRGLTRVAANEWGKDGINVNIICPLAWTAQLENFEKAYPEAFKQNVKMPPAGHYGDAELEIGRVCVQLASPDFKYMSGETITLEGGMGLRP
jgi:NAD(P)-dependent dehydrogenase (short-subunit alcohol dehydrogenase family)